MRINNPGHLERSKSRYGNPVLCHNDVAMGWEFVESLS